MNLRLILSFKVVKFKRHLHNAGDQITRCDVQPIRN